MSTHDAVIVEAIRTPVGVGKPGKGALSGIHPGDLGAHVLENLVARTGVDPTLIDDVIWGTVSQVGEQAFNAARNTLLAAGLPESVPGTTIDRQCGSSQQAVHFAAAGLVAGHYDVVIAGGTESMSRVPMFSNAVGGDGPFPTRMLARYDNGLVGQGVSAEMIAEKWGFSRQQLDEIAVESHERAAAATDSGLFAEEILPVGELAADEGIRRGTTLETLAGLRTVFKEDGVVTAGNASQISDGSARAAHDHVGQGRRARPHPDRPGAQRRRWPAPTRSSCSPASSPRRQKVLARSGLSISDIGAFEVNEAFASVLAAWLAETGADPKLTNARGGAIAIGHPLGASGARLMTTLLHRMRQDGIRYGLQTMCEGGGMANATILELL